MALLLFRSCGAGTGSLARTRSLASLELQNSSKIASLLHPEKYPSAAALHTTRFHSLSSSQEPSASLLGNRVGSNNGFLLAGMNKRILHTQWNRSLPFSSIRPLEQQGRLNVYRRSNGLIGGTNRHGGLRPTVSLHAKHALQVQLGSLSCFSSSKSPFPKKGGRTGWLGMIGTGGLVLLTKGKSIFVALKLTKFASLGSMLLSVGAYSMFFGLPYAAGMVGLILVHETGHALVMHRLGVPFSPMVFVPFVGAAVAMKKQPAGAYQEALIAFGGPALGSLGAVGVAGAAHLTDSQLLFALADFGFMINLFNMMPLGMMDGGRICGALSPYAGVAGLAMGGTMIYTGHIHNPIFYLVMLGGAYETFMRFYSPNMSLPPGYYKITPTQRIAITGGYFGLVAALFAAMAANEKFKKSPQQLQHDRDRMVEKHWVE